MAEDYKELESLQTPNGVYNSFPDKLARNELKGKVPVPDKPVEGYYLKIKAVNGDGTFTVEAVPAPTGGGELPETAKFETLAIGADGAEGVYIQSDGTAEAPALVLYGEHGDEAVRLMNLARAVDDSDAPNLAQVREMVGNGSGENPAQGGLTTEQINALDGVLRVAAYNKNAKYTAAYVAFCEAFGLPVPDSGGDSGGDDSGGGSGGEDSGGSNESAWTDGVAYEWENITGEYVDNTDGSFVTYKGWSRTPYMACSGAGVLRAEVIEQSASMSRSNSAYNVFYDADRQFISSFAAVDTDAPAVGTYTDIAVPANAAYFVVSHKDNVMGETINGIPYIRFIPYREVPV